LPGFQIGGYEVTQEQYVTVKGSNPSYQQGPYPLNNPVDSITWYEAREFCARLASLTQRTFDLPSEAQWEYACRAGTTGMWCFGNDETMLEEYAWYNANSGGH